MPSPTYVALAKTVLTSSAASVSFTGIVGTYTDLIVLISARNTGSSTNLNVKFNDTFTTDSSTNITGVGSTAASTNTQGRSLAGGLTISTDTTNTFTNAELYIPNYAGSTNKVVSATSVRENNSATVNIVNAQAFLYQTTTAISRIDFIPGSGNIDAGSRFDLYGIKNS